MLALKMLGAFLCCPIIALIGILMLRQSRQAIRTGAFYLGSSRIDKSFFGSAYFNFYRRLNTCLGFAVIALALFGFFVLLTAAIPVLPHLF